MNRFMRVFCLTALTGAIAGFAAAAQKAPKIDICGTWTGSAVLNNGTANEEFTLLIEKKEGAYLGTISTATGMAQDAELRKIVLEGDKLSFEFDLNGDPGGDVITIEVTVAADTMAGTWASLSGQGDAIEAKKQKQG